MCPNGDFSGCDGRGTPAEDQWRSREYRGESIATRRGAGKRARTDDNGAAGERPPGWRWSIMYPGGVGQPQHGRFNLRADSHTGDSDHLPAGRTPGLLARVLDGRFERSADRARDGHDFLPRLVRGNGNQLPTRGTFDLVPGVTPIRLQELAARTFEPNHFFAPRQPHPLPARENSKPPCANLTVVSETGISQNGVFALAFENGTVPTDNWQ